MSALLTLAGSTLAGCTPPGLPAPIAPAPNSGVGAPPATEPSVTIGVDSAVHGFNPHAIADYSPAAAAIAELVLPSVSSVQSDGSIRFNGDVVEKAVVSASTPFTVTYTLNRNASWSDGTPITAEDFSYLRDQMLVQPATVDPAGYRLITGIVSRNAGKSVLVSFQHPLADWQTLFSPLLPAHLLKDSPGGWTQGLAAGIPVSGSRYKMQSFDPVTGEIALARNDKYWGAQPGPSVAVFRIGSAATLTAALARGDLQAVLLQPNAVDQQALERAIPADRRSAVPLPGTVQLVFNATTGPTADVLVRQAIAAGLDLDRIRAALDGGNALGSAVPSSLTTLPDMAGHPTGPTARTDDAAAAAADLDAAGYHRESLYMSKAGSTLTLRLTYDSTNPRMVAAARLVQSQLAVIGVDINLIREDPLTAVDQQIATGTVDLGLTFVPRQSFDALAAASAFGCPAPSGSHGDTRTLPAVRTGNLSGWCSAQVQNLLDHALEGTAEPTLDHELSANLPVLPISRPSAVFAANAAITAQVNFSSSRSPFTGPISTLASWPPKR